jgi:Txe/YoeB family toxin of toxin-antitoxin system
MHQNQARIRPVSWTVLFSKQAQKDARELASASPALKQKAQALLNLLAADPYQQPPPYEAMVGDLRRTCSRHINIQNRMVVQVLEDKGRGEGATDMESLRISATGMDFSSMPDIIHPAAAHESSMLSGCHRVFHRFGDQVQMLIPGSTATSPDIDVRVAPRKLAHEPAEFLRIAFLQMPDLAQRDLVHCGGIRSKHANSLDPGPRFQRWQELKRMRAVDAIEVRPRLTTFAVSGFDCLAQRRA